MDANFRSGGDPVVTSHRRLDVYRTAIEYVAGTERVVRRIPRHRRFLADQLLRAATSIPLNIAEGAGEYSRREKARFYRIARRSATESAAMLDVLTTMQLIDEPSFRRLDDLLDRITAMLTRMSKTFERPDRASTRRVADQPPRPRPSPRPSPD